VIGCFYILPKRFFECAPAVWKFGIFFLFAYIFRLRGSKREIALPPSKITKNTPFKAETGVLQRKTASGRSSQADMRLFRFLNVHVETVFLLLLRILTLTKNIQEFPLYMHN
jgi:hypothetical protein